MRRIDMDSPFSCAIYGSGLGEIPKKENKNETL